jgi:hypothetical protein
MENVWVPLVIKWVPLCEKFVYETQNLVNVLLRCFTTEAAFVSKQEFIEEAIISGLKEDEREDIEKGTIALKKKDRTSEDNEHIKRKRAVLKKVNKLFHKLRNEAYGYGLMLNNGPQQVNIEHHVSYRSL